MPTNSAYNKMTILHITPHLGGGVGRVILNYLNTVKDSSLFRHKVACLDYANDNALAVAKKIKLELADKLSSNQERLITMISEADVILVHWWNHPLLYDFLVRVVLPPCRLVMWSHTAGFKPPYVFTEKILKYPDRFVFTTPVSFKTKEVGKLSDKQKRSLRVVWSTGGIDHVKSVKPKQHKGFNVGYIGTVDYAKLHPNFLNICSKINIPKVKFIVCGGANERRIKQEAEALGIDKKFNFTGTVADITKYLAIFDIFGYPLNPDHYGTCDQVLAESMAAGVVPVVLPNSMEKYMVKDGLTGIVAKNEADYIKAIQDLYQDRNLRNRLSKNAKYYAAKTFSVTKMAQEWEAIFKEVLVTAKTGKRWPLKKSKRELLAKDVFLESLGEYGKDFINYCRAKSTNEKNKAEKKITKLKNSLLWKSRTKGTVHQYYSFFPDDKLLACWSDLISENN